jgi:hypothetical protein
MFLKSFAADTGNARRPALKSCKRGTGLTAAFFRRWLARGSAFVIPPVRGISATKGRMAGASASQACGIGGYFLKPGAHRLAYGHINSAFTS